MAATVNGSAKCTASFTRTPDSGFLTSKPTLFDLIMSISYGSGLTAGLGDLLYAKRHTFASATQQTIDLTAAVGDDSVTNNIVKPELLIISHLGSTDGSYLMLDNAGATNPFIGWLNAAGTLKCYPSVVDSSGNVTNAGILVLNAP